MPFHFFGYQAKTARPVSISLPDIEGDWFLNNDTTTSPKPCLLPRCPPSTPNGIPSDGNIIYTHILKNQEAILEKLSGWEKQQEDSQKSNPSVHQTIPMPGTASNPTMRRGYLRPRRRTWIPIFSYLNALAMLIVLIYGMKKNSEETGYVVSISPFNVMLGPSAEVLIQMGAQFSPCMRVSADYPVDGTYDCANSSVVGLTMPNWALTFPNKTTNTDACQLSQVCGLTPFKDAGHPNQAFRLISALFIHAGIIHYFCNVIVLLCMGAAVERRVNPLRFGIAWIVGGLYGFMFGAVLLPDSTVSLGCSGALFGVTALALVDIIFHWKTIADPGLCLTKLVLLMALGFACGYAPGFDNFSHLGGFIGGLMTGIVLVQATSSSKAWRIFHWSIRLVALVVLVIMGYFLLSSFYKETLPTESSWSKYLLCLPVGGMCDAYNN